MPIRFAARKKALLHWGYDRLWHRWPVMIVPLTRNFRRRHEYFPRLWATRSLNEKILYRMIFDRRAHLPHITGKLEGRDFVRRRTEDDRLLVPLAGIVRRPSDIRSISLPPSFILKSSHACGRNLVYHGDAPPDLDHLERLCRGWLALDYGKYKREWCYKDTERAILVEHLLGENNLPLVDYKFLCFDGIPRFVEVSQPQPHRPPRWCTLTTGWTLLEETPPGAPAITIPPPKPPHLAEMLQLAATLSRGMDFVRVDLYDTNGQVWFGEMTNTPAAATERFHPRELDFLLGSYWNLDTRTPLAG